MTGSVLLLFACLAGPAWAAQDWEPVPMPDGDMHSRMPEAWREYRGAVLEDVVAADGRKALRVNVAKTGLGGLSVTATPRGGMGNRVRLTFTYRIVSGSPLSVFVGPNTFNADFRSPD